VGSRRTWCLDSASKPRLPTYCRLSLSDAIFESLLLNLWQVLLTVPAVLYADRAGRKPLWSIGSAGIALSEFLLGAFIYHNSGGKLVLIAVLLGLGFFAFSLAPVGWLMIAEIFPTRMRAKGQAVATVATWIFGFALVQLFAPLMAYLDKAYGSPAVAFWIFGFMSILALLFCWRVVPETKGRTLDEIAGTWLRT
jgi:MFS family permease